MLLRRTMLAGVLSIGWADAAIGAEQFRSLMGPVYRFVEQTPQRVPLTDWYWAHTAERFRPDRSSDGAFIRMLEEPET